MLRRDPDAVVLHPHAHAAVAQLGPHVHVGGALRRHELDGVGEQVGEDLRQRRFVAHDRRQRFVHHHARVSRRHVVRHLLGGALHRPVQVERREPQLGARDAAVGQQIADQLVHRVRPGHHPLGILLASLIELVAVILEQRLAEAAHGAQRRAQVV